MNIQIKTDKKKDLLKHAQEDLKKQFEQWKKKKVY